MSGEIPSELLYEDDQAIVIKDINPQAPIHILLIPRVKIPRLVDADVSHQALLGHLLLLAGKMAKQLGCDEAFRLIINNGADAGQTVFHLHLHIVLGALMGNPSAFSTALNQAQARCWRISRRPTGQADGNRFNAALDRLRALLKKTHTARVKIIVGTTDLQPARGDESFQSG